MYTVKDSWDGMKKLNPPIHDLNELMAACSRSTWTGEDCYNVFRQAGIQYGPAFEGIQQLFIGEREVLAQLKLPEHLLPEMNSYVLHPCILDSALQASIGMMLEHPEVDGKKAGHGSGGPQPSVPFALKKVRIYKACAQDMWAWVRYSSDSSSDGKGMTFDIDLFDQEGSVCVRLIGFSSRQLPDPESTAPGADTTARSEMLLLKPYWREMEVEGAGRSRKTPDAEHIVILCGALACRLSEMQLEFPSASFIPIGLIREWPQPKSGLRMVPCRCLVNFKRYCPVNRINRELYRPLCLMMESSVCMLRCRVCCKVLNSNIRLLRDS